MIAGVLGMIVVRDLDFAGAQRVLDNRPAMFERLSSKALRAFCEAAFVIHYHSRSIDEVGPFFDSESISVDGCIHD